MGESHPSRATAPACQLLTEQPCKDLQTMGNVSAVCLKSIFNHSAILFATGCCFD